MDVSTIPANRRARRRRRRLGRGIGSGRGKTAARGQKGQRARTGKRRRPGFEGGRTPLVRLLPKRGFRRKARNYAKRLEVLNVKDLEGISEKGTLTPERMQELGLIRDATHRVKLLGGGRIKQVIGVKLDLASKSARQKMLKAGGTIELRESAKS